MLTKAINLKGSKSRAALIVAAVIVVFLQILIVSHAARYGDGTHEHDGKICVLSLAVSADHKFIATASFALIAIVAMRRLSGVVAQTERARLAVRAARPRGPPTA